MRDILTSPDSVKIKHDRRVYNTRLLVLFSILFLLIIGALAFFSGHSRLTINNVVVTGTHIISSSDVESLVNDRLSGRYFYLFSHKNNLIYPKGKIYDDLRKAYPRIEQLSVYRDDWNTLHLSITERQGSYLYCGSTIPEATLDIGENCYFVNTDGYVFDKAPYFSGNIYFKYYITIPNSDNVLGQYLMPVEDFHKLARFIDGVTDIGFKPNYIVTGNDGIDSLYLNSNQGGIDHKILFKNNEDLDLILDNLSIAMKKKEFADEINSKYTTLQYIDLRFKDKVLYKFQ